MARAVVQGYLLVCDLESLSERNGTICKIVSRADEPDSEGSLLERGAAFWVKFGDSDEEYFIPGEYLRPWYATD